MKLLCTISLNYAILTPISTSISKLHGFFVAIAMNYIIRALTIAAIFFIGLEGRS